jgi:hypothetical protein
MQRRLPGTLALVEILISVLVLALAIWPVSGACSGRTLGMDCESWFILGINVFGPVGALALACGAWSLKKGGWAAQYVLLAGVLVVSARWALAS